MQSQEDRIWAARRRLLYGESAEALAEAFGVRKETIAQWTDSHLDLLQSEHGASAEDFLAFQNQRDVSANLSDGDRERLYNRSSPKEFITSLQAWNGYMNAIVSAPAMPAQNQLEIAAQVVHRDNLPTALLTERSIQRFRLEVPPGAMPYRVTVNNPTNPRNFQTGLRARDVVELYDWADIIQGQNVPVPPSLTPLPLEVDDQRSGAASEVVSALEYVLRRQGVDLRSAPRDAVGKPLISWGQWPSVTGSASELRRLQEIAKTEQPILRKPQLAVRWDVDERLLVDELITAFSIVWSAFSSSPSMVAVPEEPGRARLGYWPEPFVSEGVKRSLRAVFGIASDKDRQPLVASGPLPPEQLSRIAASAEVIQTVCSRIFALADGQERTPAEAVNANLANDIEIRAFLKTYSEPLETVRALTKNEITEAMRDFREHRRRIDKAHAVLGGREVAVLAHTNQPIPGERAFESADASSPSSDVEGAHGAQSESGLSSGPSL